MYVTCDVSVCSYVTCDVSVSVYAARDDLPVRVYVTCDVSMCTLPVACQFVRTLPVMWQLVQDFWQFCGIQVGLDWHSPSRAHSSHSYAGSWRSSQATTGNMLTSWRGPLARYVKLRVAHAPGTFSPPPRVSDPDMHHGPCVRTCRDACRNR